MSKGSIVKLLSIPLLFVVLGAGFYYLLANGLVIFNSPGDSEYPIRGVDVSSYQGKIDWQALARNKIRFAYLKATEGSSAVDPEFSTNWKEASKTTLRFGAYHFLSFDSPGSTQADNFIKQVPKDNKALPPAVDVEFYDDKASNPPSKETVRKILNDFLKKVEAYYGKKAVIYSLYDAYGQYIQGSYPDNPVWIRDIFSYPKLEAERNWTFWQYTGKGKLSGYQGQEPFIDLNVFRGTDQEFKQL